MHLEHYSFFFHMGATLNSLSNIDFVLDDRQDNNCTAKKTLIKLPTELKIIELIMIQQKGFGPILNFYCTSTRASCTVVASITRIFQC